MAWARPGTLGIPSDRTEKEPDLKRRIFCNPFGADELLLPSLDRRGGFEGKHLHTPFLPVESGTFAGVKDVVSLKGCNQAVIRALVPSMFPFLIVCDLNSPAWDAGTQEAFAVVVTEFPSLVPAFSQQKTALLETLRNNGNISSSLSIRIHHFQQLSRLLFVSDIRRYLPFAPRMDGNTPQPPLRS